MNGSRPSEGRIELCSGEGVWGTVAAVPTFSNAAARVVCKRLGYTDECKFDKIIIMEQKKTVLVTTFGAYYV